MLGFIIGELVVLLATWIAFIVARVQGRLHFIPRWRTVIGRQLLGVAVLGVVETVGLIAIGTGHAFPLWTYAIIFGLVNLVTIRWLYVAWRSRHVTHETSS